MRLLQFQPGSALWLFVHEWRMFFYEMGESSKSKSASDAHANGKTQKRKIARGISLKVGLFFAALWLAAHYLAWRVLADVPVFDVATMAPVRWITTFVLILIATFMLSSALNRSVKALFERGDLDLLLSSPLPTKTIFSVRLAAIVVGISALHACFFSPVINAGAALGHIGWLAAYPVLLSIAMLSASAAMLLTLSLVKLIGIQRTHTVAHLLSALTGAVMFLMSQSMSHINPQLREKWMSTAFIFLDQHRLLAPDSWLWLPARAVCGDVVSAAGFLGLGVICCWLTTRYTHHFFVRGVQQAGGTSQSSKTTSALRQPVSRDRQRRFTSNIWLVVLKKEWRLLFRDIELLAQIGLQLLYMFPLFFVIFKQGVLLSGVVSGLTYLSISLAGSLIWVIVSAEDAPDLLQSAPVMAAQIGYAKLVAAIAPVYVLMSPVLVWLWLHDVKMGATLTLCSLGGVTGTVLVYRWLGKSTTRDRFKRRGQGNVIPTLLETVNALSWTAVSAGLLVSDHFTKFGIAGVAGVIIVAWALRNRR